MNALLPFIGPTYDDILAGLRLKQPAIAEQPRDADTGKFVSRKDIRTKELRSLYSSLSKEQVEAAKMRAVG